MATRILLLYNADVDNVEEVVSTIDGELTVKPPAGIKWTFVELRIGLDNDVGEWKIYFDTEKYFNGRSELDFLALGRPHTVALDVVQPHFIQMKAIADTANMVAIAELVLEESAVSGA